MLIYLLKQILGALFLGLPLVIFARAIWRWLRASPRIGVPAWRGYVAMVGIGLAGVSALLWVVSLIWARAIGGFPFYDPVLLRFYRWGFLTSALGLFVSLVGKGKLRWPTTGLSLLMSMLWFMAATGE
jgi:hypothetical protein